MILTIETSGEVCGVALHDGHRIIAVREDHRPRIHDAALNGQVAAVLSEAGIGFGDVRMVACSVGPGSFTGIRIGLSYAKGLCHAMGVPLIPVPTLAALAHSQIGAAASHGAEGILVALKAEGKKWYCGLFDSSGTALSEPETLLMGDPVKGPRSVIGIGNATSYFAFEGMVLATEETPPRPQFAAVLASEMAKRGAGSDPAAVEPLYVTPVVHSTQ